VKTNKNEEIYRYIASQYEKEMGKQLQAEKGMLEQQWPRTDTRRLDELVRQGTRRRKKVKTARWAAVIAACVLFAVIIPLWYPPVSDVRQPGSADSAGSAAEEQPPLEEAPQELILLSFELPDNLTVDSVGLDNGMSVYYLSDSGLDPVVMQLRYAGADDFRADGLTEIEIAGKTVYGRSEDAYHLLTFESGGIVYTLTCAYDINTLVPLCEKIL